MATSSSTMHQNYNVFVSAMYLGARQNNFLSKSIFYVTLSVSSSYVSDSTLAVPREIKNPSKQQSLLYPCDSLSWDSISKMVSDMNIPFSLDKIQWRSNPKETWISLKNQDDLISSILNLALSKPDLISTTGIHPQQIDFYLSINKEIILPKHEFEDMVNARRFEELSSSINEAISWANQQPPYLRFLYLRDLAATSEYKDYQSVIERTIRESQEPKPIPAAKEAIERLEESIFNSDDSTNSWCAVCMKKFKIGNSVSEMPCSHKFHKTCIITWLNSSHTCPLCRFKLLIH